jgi:hypothetical protein
MGARGCGKEALERNSGMAKLMVERGRGPALTMKAGGGAHGSPAGRRREGSGGYVQETKGESNALADCGRERLLGSSSLAYLLQPKNKMAT